MILRPKTLKQIFFEIVKEFLEGVSCTADLRWILFI